MKAVIVRAPGGLDRIERTQLPDPGVPGSGSIRVRLHANSVNYHDYGVVNTPDRVADGRIPMSDGAGLVESVGDGVTEFGVGDHVVSCFFPNWLEGPPTVADFSTVPGDGIDGYAREFVVAPATAFSRVPKGYSFTEAATLPTAGVTAWRALVVNGALKPGELGPCPRHRRRFNLCIANCQGYRSYRRCDIFLGREVEAGSRPWSGSYHQLPSSSGLG